MDEVVLVRYHYLWSPGVALALALVYSVMFRTIGKSEPISSLQIDELHQHVPIVEIDRRMLLLRATCSCFMSYALPF